MEGNLMTDNKLSMNGKILSMLVPITSLYGLFVLSRVSAINSNFTNIVAAIKSGNSNIEHLYNLWPLEPVPDWQLGILYALLLFNLMVSVSFVVALIKQRDKELEVEENKLLGADTKQLQSDLTLARQQHNSAMELYEYANQNKLTISQVNEWIDANRLKRFEVGDNVFVVETEA